MRRSQQNRPGGEFRGQRPHNVRKRRGTGQGRMQEGKRQGPPPHARHNRRRNQHVDGRNQEKHLQRGRRAPFRQRRRDWFRPAAGFTGYDDRFEIEVELPGVKEKDISVSVAGKMLLVKGKKHRNQSEEQPNFRRSGLQYGKFHHAFPLLPMAKTDEIKANFNNGVLTIVVPKKEEAKPKEIPINADA